MKTLFFITAVAATFIVSSCKKEKKKSPEDHTHSTTATITLTSPQEGDTIQGNFNVVGSIAGTSALHGYQVTIKKTSDNSIVFEKEVHDHLENFTINEVVTHTFSSYTSLKLEVVVAVDHEGNQTSKSVNFTVH